MNRKSFASAALAFLAATVFTSCSADQDLENSLAPAANASSDEITFRVQNATAASAASSRAITTAVTDFKVSAIDRGNAYFSSPLSVFTTDNGSSWSSTSRASWPADGSLTFVAYVDRSPRAASFTLDGGNASFTDYEVPADVHDQSDLMYAVAKDATKDSSKGGVNLQFRHALSQISFTAQNNHPAYAAIEILSIELGGVKGQGTYSFPQNSTSAAARGEWTIDANSSDRSYTVSELGVTLPSCGADRRGEKVSVTSATRAGDDNVMFLMPQSLAEGVYIKVKARMTLQDAPGASYISEEVIPVAVDWKEGQRYSYNIAWNATPITFDVSVGNWREVSATAE